VTALPPRQREAVVLTHYEQVSTAEAAAVMATSETNVRVLLTHGRAKLRHQLRRHLDD
jgi:RNA polymerase sigma-70 factor (ECF subfamily)